MHMEKEKWVDYVFPQYGLGFFLLLVCRVRGAVVIIIISLYLTLVKIKIQL